MKNKRLISFTIAKYQKLKWISVDNQLIDKNLSISYQQKCISILFFILLWEGILN